MQARVRCAQQHAVRRRRSLDHVETIGEHRLRGRRLVALEQRGGENRREYAGDDTAPPGVALGVDQRRAQRCLGLVRVAVPQVADGDDHSSQREAEHQSLALQSGRQVGFEPAHVVGVAGEERQQCPVVRIRDRVDGILEIRRRIFPPGEHRRGNAGAIGERGGARADQRGLELCLRRYIRVVRDLARDLQRPHRAIAQRHDPTRFDPQLDAGGEGVAGQALEPFARLAQLALANETPQGALGEGLRERVVAGGQRMPARVVKALAAGKPVRRAPVQRLLFRRRQASRIARAGSRGPAGAAGSSRAFRRRSGSVCRLISWSMKAAAEALPVTASHNSGSIWSRIAMRVRNSATGVASREYNDSMK